MPPFLVNSSTSMALRPSTLSTGAAALGTSIPALTPTTSVSSYSLGTPRSEQARLAPSPTLFSRVARRGSQLLGAVALVTGAFLLNNGCELDHRGLGGRLDGGVGEGGMMMDAGVGGDGGVGGDTGVGGDGGSAPVPGPVLTWPPNGETFPHDRALISWNAVTPPAGLTVAGYEVCATTGPASTIDDPSECPIAVAPNPTIPEARTRRVMITLLPSSSYLVKVRARMSDGSFSEYSSLRVFLTNNPAGGRWPFDGNAMDVSGGGINGTVMGGAAFGAGIQGQAVQCNGVNGYVDMGTSSSLNFAGPVTALTWVFANVIPSVADTGILVKGNLNYALTYHSNGNVFFYINNGGNYLNTPMSIGSWHHVVGTFDGTTNAGGMRLYVDGVETGNRASGTATTGATGPLLFGRYVNYLNGRADESAIYGAVLPANAVKNEFCSVRALVGDEPLPAPCP